MVYSIYAAKTKIFNITTFKASIFHLDSLARNIYANYIQKNINISPVILINKSSMGLFQNSSIIIGTTFSTFIPNIDIELTVRHKSSNGPMHEIKNHPKLLQKSDNKLVCIVIPSGDPRLDLFHQFGAPGRYKDYVTTPGFSKLKYSSQALNFAQFLRTL